MKWQYSSSYRLWLLSRSGYTGSHIFAVIKPDLTSYWIAGTSDWVPVPEHIGDRTAIENYVETLVRIES